MKTLKYIIISMFMLLPYSILWAQCAMPATNLISWWTGDDTAQDLYGNNDGVLQGGTTYISGVVNNAFLFDGVDDVVVVPDNDDLDLTGDMTLELWVKQTEFDNVFHTVISKGGIDENDNELAVFLMVFENATPIFYFKDTAGVFIEKGGPSFEDFSWHHYAYVRQGNMHILYADGFEFGWENFTNPPASSAGLPLTIGAQYNNSPSSTTDYRRFFGGEVDEIGVYNRALSEAEIQSIYNAGIDGKCTDVLSLEEMLLSKSEVKVFPNPVIDAVTFKIDEQLMNNHQDLRLSILDLTGRIVVSNIELQAETKIDVSMLLNGMYLYTISSHNSILKSGQILKK